MKSRRSFFRRFAAIVATIALAPEIAFRAKLDLPVLEWKANTVGIYEQLRACERVSDEPLNLNDLFDNLYQIKRQREANPNASATWIHNS